jgi:predicted kinase
MMNKIIILVGSSCSGKSTWAKQYIQRGECGKTVIVSRDAIRMALFGFTDETYSEYYAQTKEVISERESEVSKFFDNQIWYALQKGNDVIADNTHLQKKYINQYKMFGVELELVLWNIELDEALKRDLERTKKVGSDIIKRQVKYFNSLMDTTIVEEIDEYNVFVKGVYENCKKRPHYVSKPDCVIVDLDGCLCLKGDRGVHDLSKVILDIPNSGIAEIVRVLNSRRFDKFCGDETNIIFCSGREDICREDTLVWLNDPKNGVVHSDVPFSNFHLRMRNSGDYRKDWMVKAELWNDIQDEYNIIAMFDDRQQVCSLARKLGYTVAQVAAGDF